MNKLKENTSAVGIITVKSVIDKLHYNISKVKDPNTRKIYSMMQARKKGILGKLGLFGWCHEKTDLQVFVVVIPKEGWARVAAPILLLV